MGIDFTLPILEFSSIIKPIIMAAKKTSNASKVYEVIQVACEKKDCNESFDVVITPILTSVAAPAQDVSIDLLMRSEEKKELINDYIVVKCPCGDVMQRVYLKNKTT